MKKLLIIMCVLAVTIVGLSAYSLVSPKFIASPTAQNDVVINVEPELYHALCEVLYADTEPIVTTSEPEPVLPDMSTSLYYVVIDGRPHFLTDDNVDLVELEDGMYIVVDNVYYKLVSDANYTGDVVGNVGSVVVDPNDIDGTVEDILDITDK